MCNDKTKVVACRMLHDFSLGIRKLPNEEDIKLYINKTNPGFYKKHEGNYKA